MPESRVPATDAAAALLRRLVSGGVSHLVVSPGSRSQALALVAADLEARGAAHLHVRIDERVAGFTALGIGRETRMPGVVVCTSGTAVANLLPAVLEAHHAGVPLVLLTADRPPELRGVGANQTTRQPGMFSPHVRFEADLPVPGGSTDAWSDIADDALAAALGRGGQPSGPVHLNVPYREPLAGALPEWTEAAPPHREDAPRTALTLTRGPRTVVVAGADAGPAAEQLAHEGGWPLIAEIVSGARFGRHLVHGYRDLLRDADLGGRVERVVVFGHPTLSREVTALLSRTDVETDNQLPARAFFTRAGFASSRFRLIAGSPIDVMPKLRDGAYDIVFINGDKLEYVEYVAGALRLLRHGGLLIVNDVLWHNRVADEGDESDESIIIREALEAVTASESYTQTLLSVGNGLLVAVKD